MSLRTFIVKPRVDIVERNDGHPAEKPTHASIVFDDDEQGYLVHAGASHGNYARDVADVLARATSGSVVTTSGKVLLDCASEPASTWPALVAAWRALEREHEAKREGAMADARERWQKEHGGDRFAVEGNDWSDV